MEILSLVLAVISYGALFVVFYSFVMKRVERKVMEKSCETHLLLSKTFRELSESYSVADVKEVDRRISFLESLIERGFNQQREQIEMLDNRTKMSPF